MAYSLDDTIAAIATAPGGAARGIIRISGPQAVAAVARCFDAASGVSLDTVAAPSVIAGHFRLAGREPLRVPCDVYLWPDTRSYTRSPVGELHMLGSPPLLEAALRTVCSDGARLAEPGEFTLRAFLAGRIDLTQAEAVLGVIDATSDRDLRVALAQLAGGLAEPLHRLRDELLDLLAELEAGLDFVEEDIQFITSAELSTRVRACADSVERLIQQISSRGEAVETPRVALVGCPNVGKSSLLNAVAGRSAALVSPLPGTTRDYLSARLTFGGQTIELVDTAGVEHVDEPNRSLRGAAQQMTSAVRDTAQLQLLCLDSTRPINAWELAELNRSEEDRWLVWTKSDLESLSPSKRGPGEGQHQTLITSSVTGQGIDTLRRRLEDWLARRGLGGAVAGTAARSRESLRLALEHLRHALDTVASDGGEELVAADLRGALLQLGQVAGAVYTDDVLDRIFSRFCIGK